MFHRSTPPKAGNLIRAGFARIGVEVRRHRPHPYRPANLSLEPRTILDIGAADGTPDLYRAFPNAHLVAFEPIREQLEQLRASLGGRPCELMPLAIGSSEGELHLSVDPTNLLKSSFHSRTHLTVSPGSTVTRPVPLRKLDAIVQECNWPPPYALKIDTEGHELDVLLGATQTLSKTVVLYCETSVGPRFQGGYTFSDVARLLIDRGFELVDVLAAPRGADGRILFLDAVWAPQDAGPRQSEQGSSPSSFPSDTRPQTK